MDAIAYIVGEFLHITTAVAIITGSMLGFYLAAINGFAKVRSLSKSLITNLVTGLSFFAPLFWYFISLGENERADRWFAALVLYVVFSTTADVSNYVWCRWGPFRPGGRFYKE